MIPEYIRKKFTDGWSSHVPLTYLTDNACIFKNKAASTASQDILSFDPKAGQVTTTSKTLSDNGELNLTFDEWHQAWRRLLELIKLYMEDEYPLWVIHYNFILNSENRAEMWPLYLAYDAEIRKRTTQYSIDPSVFSIGIWNDLEARYSTKKVLTMFHSELRQHPELFSFLFNNSSSQPPRIPSQGSSFRNQQPPADPSKTGRCIFCGDCSKTHTSRNCIANTCTNGSPCHLLKQGPSGNRQSPSGKKYCFAWNGSSGCNQAPCTRGEHWCTLCGSPSHNAQQCNSVA